MEFNTNRLIFIRKRVRRLWSSSDTCHIKLNPSVETLYIHTKVFERGPTSAFRQ